MEVLTCSSTTEQGPGFVCLLHMYKDLCVWMMQYTFLPVVSCYSTDELHLEIWIYMVCTFVYERTPQGTFKGRLLIIPGELLFLFFYHRFFALLLDTGLLVSPLFMFLA